MHRAQAADRRQRWRQARGAANFQSRDAVVRVEGAAGAAPAVQLSGGGAVLHSRAQLLVTEMMILANEAAATLGAMPPPPTSLPPKMQPQRLSSQKRGALGPFRIEGNLSNRVCPAGFSGKHRRGGKHLHPRQRHTAASVFGLVASDTPNVQSTRWAAGGAALGGRRGGACAAALPQPATVDS